MTQSAPALSVVVVPFAGRSYVGRCLDALARQVDVDGVETLVPYDDTLGDISAWRARFPTVQFLRAGDRRTYAELRALGVRSARGAVVALTEDHCVPDPTWCACILEAHQAGHAAVGGAVEKGPDTALNWAVYLADYSRYMNPLPEGPADYLTDCNVAYKRSALESIAPTWADEFHETTVNWTLQARGETLWLCPRMIVQQQRSLGLREAARDRYGFGRLFASTRVAASSPLQRILLVAGVVLLPAVLIGRLGRHVLTKRRGRREYVRALPALVLVTTVWACGELVGYLTGRPGRWLTGRSPTEVAAPRPTMHHEARR